MCVVVGGEGVDITHLFNKHSVGRFQQGVHQLEASGTLTEEKRQEMEHARLIYCPLCRPELASHAEQCSLQRL